MEQSLRIKKANSSEQITESGPDISFALNYFCGYLEKATNEHWNHLKRILRYLKETLELELSFKQRSENKLTVCGYVDLEWANDIEDRKSTTGFFVFANIVVWRSRKHPQ